MRVQSFGEEVANAVSHGFGALTVLVAAPFVVAASAQRGTAAAAGVCVYCGTIAVLYVASTMYHAARPGRAKRVLQVLDHSAIFLLIAGTYTPFALGVLWGMWGWGLLFAVWSLAAFGIAIEAAGWKYAHRVAVGLYLGMGWLAVIAIGPIVEHVATWGIVLLVAGGLFYTLGVAFYALKGVRYAHFVWHLFVLVGSALHLVAVARYAV